MITQETKNMVIEEREYAEQQSELNRQHQLQLKDKEIELEKYKVKLERTWFKQLILLPVKILLIIPLSFGVLRKSDISPILKLYD